MHLRSASEGGYRYGVVLLIAFVAVVFFIVTPEGPLSRAIGLLLMLSTLVVSVLAGGGDVAVRRAIVVLSVTVGVGVAAAVLFAGTTGWIGAALGIALVGGTVSELVVGLARMLRDQGVTVRAVAGALAVYLLLGLMFSQAVTVAAHVGSGPFFSEGIDGSQSQHVYFAFTTMTTTGYGDLTPGASFGRALSVVTMLVGQIYLVTVIALLVGNLRRGRAA